MSSAHLTPYFFELLHMRILASEKQQTIQNHCYGAETCNKPYDSDLFSPTYIFFLNFNISVNENFKGPEQPYF